MSLHRLLQAKNHQWTLWQACGTLMTIWGVLKLLVLLKGIRGCVSQKCFWNPRGSRFSCPTIYCYYLIHPPDVCISVSVSFLVEGQWQRKKSISAIYIVKWGEIRSLSENKFLSLCLYMCLHVSEVYDHRARVGRICWVQSLCIIHSLTAEEDLVSFWMQVLMLSIIHVW